MKRRNWLIEDNLVALYMALYRHKGLDYELDEIEKIIRHKGFPMRVQNYIAIHTKGKRGLIAALKSPTFKSVYRMFAGFGQRRFARLVNLILYTKSRVHKDNIMAYRSSGVCT